ncbi:MAG: CRTAC1 family protein [Myxococcales bacterium]|nr:CRTAC1 family protein [Myxococcales bacterium]
MDGDRGLRWALWLLSASLGPWACGDDAISPGAEGLGPGGSTTSTPSGSDGTTTGADTAEPGRDPTGHADESTTGEPDLGPESTTGEPEPPVVEPSFAEVAVQAGLDHIHGEWHTAPDCLIDQIGPGQGGFCLPERMTAGAAAADYDGDGFVDLVTTRTHGRPLLYRNAGDGTFTEEGLAAGLGEYGWGTAGATWFDIDNDGDQDLYITTLGDTRYYLFVNDGTGHFTEEAIDRGASLKSPYVHAGMSAAAGDYDLDGWTDLYVGEWRTLAGLGKVPSHSRLLRNLGPGAPGHFEDVTEAAGVVVDDVWIGVTPLAGTYSFSPSFADLDGDGWPELATVSDFGCSRLFWNQGDGTFVDGTVASGVGIDKNGMGSTYGDYDADGDLDWFVTAITDDYRGATLENRLYRNDGGRHFTEIAEPMGVGAGGWGWGTTFFDPDNDGDLDLLMTNGFYYSAHLAEHNHLWLNPGDGTLGPEVSVEAGMGAIGQGRGLMVFDHDHDGDLDVYVANNFNQPSLYENLTGQLNDWLRVRAVGTTSNRDGLGVRVTVRVTEGGPSQLHEIGGSIAHYMGQPEKVAHFGLGWGDDPVAEVRVVWPASGQEQVFTDVDRNIELLVEEPQP